MPKNSLLRKTLLISLFGHFTLFSIFSFSFGPIQPKLNYGGVNFLGMILPRQDLIKGGGPWIFGRRQMLAREDARSLLQSQKVKDYSLREPVYLKPNVALAQQAEKLGFVPSIKQVRPIIEPRKPAVMLYPQLPYNFLLYFKDRQVVHIEVSFNIVSSGGNNSVVVKRKISSGNLEADLLSMRYISHYLFLQQAGFAPNKWQTVKIELSKKND